MPTLGACPRLAPPLGGSRGPSPRCVQSLVGPRPRPSSAQPARQPQCVANVPVGRMAGACPATQSVAMARRRPLPVRRATRRPWGGSDGALHHGRTPLKRPARFAAACCRHPGWVPAPRVVVACVQRPLPGGRQILPAVSTRGRQHLEVAPPPRARPTTQAAAAGERVARRWWRPPSGGGGGRRGYWRPILRHGPGLALFVYPRDRAQLPVSMDCRRSDCPTSKQQIFHTTEHDTRPVGAHRASSESAYKALPRPFCVPLSLHRHPRHCQSSCRPLPSKRTRGGSHACPRLVPLGALKDCDPAAPVLSRSSA